MVEKQLPKSSIRVQNAWFFFPVKDESLNFSEIRIFLSEISTAYHDFRLSWKMTWKPAKLMSIIEPYKIGPIPFNERTKQGSIFWMSKPLLEKRIIGIGTDFVIFSKSVLWKQIYFFFGAKYRQNQLFLRFCRIYSFLQL